MDRIGIEYCSYCVAVAVAVAAAAQDQDFDILRGARQ